MSICRQRREFELDASSGEYEGVAAWKLHSDCSDNKRTLEFLGEFQAMIDNDPTSQSGPLELLSFFIRQVVVHEDIQYFSYKRKKGQFLSQAVKDKSKEHAAKLFNKLKHPFQLNILWFFFVV